MKVVPATERDVQQRDALLGQGGDTPHNVAIGGVQKTGGPTETSHSIFLL